MLHRKKSTSGIYRKDIIVDDVTIPMIVYRERRSNWRISLGQRSVNLRIPDQRAWSPKGDPIDWATSWVMEKFRKEPALFNRYLLGVPYEGKVYETLFGAYELKLEENNRKSATGIVKDDRIILQYPGSWDLEMKGEIFPKVISRVLAQELHDPFFQRVVHLNTEHFRYIIEGISFKYNKSNWGSCSFQGNLNFSTRLFLAPPLAVDYVIIHELAHLEQHNHSPAFWTLVEHAMPHYRDQVKWLKKYGSHLYY